MVYFKKTRWENYLSKLKTNPDKYHSYLETDRERKRTQRKNTTLTSKQLEKRRKECRERVRLCRLKKKLRYGKIKVTSGPAGPMENDGGYKTPQALGKALNKLKPHLPRSPRKRKAVVCKLASSCGIDYKGKSKAPTSNRSLPESTVKLVQDYYSLDSISRQAPGRKDFVCVKNKDKKMKIQKRHLMWNLRETYNLFQKDHPDVQISLSKFCSLRPANVKFSSDMPRDVCLCQHHENVKLLCDCLKKEIAEFPPYSGAFVNNFVCDSNSEVCMTGKCKNCPKPLLPLEDELPEHDTTWYQWERVTKTLPSKTGKAKKVVKMLKVNKEGSVEDAMTSLTRQLPKFLQHVFIQRKQSQFFQDKIVNLEENEAVIQIDFAENYTCYQQDEIQAAHWSQDQVTLFTVAIWSQSKESSFASHVIVSDDLSHDKKSVAVFIDKILKEVKECNPGLKVVHIFSDGPSSQFKNRYIVSFLKAYHQKTGVKILWHYFATSHGKGVVDGIGGTVKRMVWNEVSTRKVASVTNAESFASVAKQCCQSTKVAFITKKDIEKASRILQLDDIFKNAKAFPGISKLHCLEVHNSSKKNTTIKSRLYSSQDTSSGSPQPSSDDRDSEGSRSDDSDNEMDFDSDEQYSVYEGSESLSEGSLDKDAVDDFDDDVNSDIDNSVLDDNDDDSDGIDDCCDDQSTTSEINCTATLNIDAVQSGLPNKFTSVFSDICSELVVQPYNNLLLEMIVNDELPFGGSPLITSEDLRGLYGISSSSQGRWLSNFIIDAYLGLLKATVNEGLKVEVISWEQFERGVSNIPADTILQGQVLHGLDLILVPCNSQMSKHWFLLVVYPKQRCIVTLDSMSTTFVKPSAKSAIFKMMKFLQELDSSIDYRQWNFYASTTTGNGIPQQENNFDCGVFVCLYARCLVHKTKMVAQSSISQFRKLMVLELHNNKMQCIPPNTVMCGEYYAVDYVNKFYIGRVLEVDGEFMQFKFLHGVGAYMYNWPIRDDIAKSHISCVFFGPIELQGNGPFAVVQHSVIDKVFKAKLRQMKKSNNNKNQSKKRTVITIISLTFMQ